MPIMMLGAIVFAMIMGAVVLLLKPLKRITPHYVDYQAGSSLCKVTPRSHRLGQVITTICRATVAQGGRPDNGEVGRRRLPTRFTTRSF